MTEKKLTSFDEFESEMLARPGVRREYEALSPRYDMIRSLIRRRTELGLSQTQLAKLIGTSQPAISRLEKGDADTTLNTFFRVTNALSLDVSLSVKAKNKAPREKARV